MARPTLFSDFLTLLGVAHTARYSDMRFRAYPTRHTFTALQDLLAEYGVLSTVLDDSADKGAIDTLKPPFVARMADRFVIVTALSPAEVTVREKTGRTAQLTRDEFMGQWTGAALTASPMDMAGEPDLREHRMKCMAETVFSAGLGALAAFFIVYLFITRGVWTHWSWIAALALYGAGIYVSYLLVLKESHVQSAAADAMCGAIQKEGCSTVLATSASSFLGVLPWAEVGFTYFTVSFAALLLFPQTLHAYLAGIAVCCLPYSLWSVTYQKFKAHAWCTLCLSVQSLFWIIFAVYLIGGDLHGIFPLQWWPLSLLVAAYGLALCVYHKLIPKIYHADRADHASEQSAVRP